MELELKRAFNGENGSSPAKIRKEGEKINLKILLVKSRSKMAFKDENSMN